MIQEQLTLWQDPKQIILEKEKVDMSTLRDLKTRKYPFNSLPENTYFLYKTGGINLHMKDLGPVFPFVKNFKGKTLKQSPLTSGKDNPYPNIHINSGGVTYKCSLHKIVGLAFLPNDDFKNKCIIDHLDNNILNYMPENLEWVNHSENSLRRYRAAGLNK